MVAADTIIFAIQSVLKLGIQARAAFVDCTRNRALVLPLPNFQSKPDVFDAVEYFKGNGKKHIKESDFLKQRKNDFETVDMLSDIVNTLSAEDKNQLITLHNEFLTLDMLEKGYDFGQPADGHIINEDLINLLKIRQWRKGNDSTPTVLRRFAGVFFDIGVEYFARNPTVLNKHSKSGKLLHAYFTGLDEIDFTKMFLEDRMGELPEKLLMATLETVADRSKFLIDDPKYQQLITVTSRSLFNAIGARIENIRQNTGGVGDMDREARVRAWGEMVFRCLLDSGGRYVISNPKEFFGLGDDGQNELISHVGQSVLDLILDQPQGQLDRIFGKEGLGVVVKSSLEVLGNHPELILKTDNAGLGQLLSAIATDLSQQELVLNAGIVPDIMSMILTKTNESLHLFWPDWAEKPENHLMLTAVSQMLDILTDRQPGAGWEFSFTRGNLLDLTQVLLDELVSNPAWLLDRAGNVSDTLKTALSAMITVIRKQDDRRLSTGDAAVIIGAGLKAIALRKEFTDIINGRPVVAAVIDTVLASIFRDQDDRATWRLVRSEIITGAVKLALEELATAGLVEEKLKSLEDFMKSQIDTINQGQPWNLEDFANGLNQAIN